MLKTHYHFVVIGGGAAGFFAALAAKDENPASQVLLLEKTSAFLSKVRISGGGRCNVTHACFEPRELVKNYPRGQKALIGPFTRFQPSDTVHWFESRGVHLKTEADGRMFPVTDSSQTIIDCLMHEAKQLGVELVTRQSIEKIEKQDNNFILYLNDSTHFTCKSLLLATGSHPFGHQLANSFGHTVQVSVPSLFTFNIPHFPLVDLAGISLEVKLQLTEANLMQQGRMLITHWGFSGPAALKLSAWGARYLYEKQYQVPLKIDWIPHVSQEAIVNGFKQAREGRAQQSLSTNNLFDLPKNLWKKLVEQSKNELAKRLSELSNQNIQSLVNSLKADVYHINGKTTHKEEFVTCGGISLDEVNFKTMESRLCPGLYFAGEILDIDAVTGGFNFQNAWTTGWIAGRSATN